MPVCGSVEGDGTLVEIGYHGNILLKTNAGAGEAEIESLIQWRFLQYAGEVEGVGTGQLVCVGRLLRMGGESLPRAVWTSVGGRLTGKGELDAWVVWAVI